MVNRVELLTKECLNDSTKPKEERNSTLLQQYWECFYIFIPVICKDYHQGQCMWPCFHESNGKCILSRSLCWCFILRIVITCFNKLLYSKCAGGFQAAVRWTHYWLFCKQKEQRSKKKPRSVWSYPIGYVTAFETSKDCFPHACFLEHGRFIPGRNLDSGRLHRRLPEQEEAGSPEAREDR